MAVEECRSGLAIDDRANPKVLRVALIDTEPVDRVVTQHILTRRGHEVTSFDELYELVEQVRSEPVDVVVVSGDASYLDDLHNSLGGHNLPIVAITNDEIDDERAAKCAIILARPVGSRELLAAVAIASRTRSGAIVHR